MLMLFLWKRWQQELNWAFCICEISFTYMNILHFHFFFLFFCLLGIFFSQKLIAGMLLN